MARRINSKAERRAARRHAARKQVSQTTQGQQDLFPFTGKVYVGHGEGLAKLAEIRRKL
jgi:hypothetical protein